MADGSLLITIDDSLKARVQKAASEAGSSIDEFVAQALDFAVGPETDSAIDALIASQTMEAGDGIPLEQFMQRLERFGRPPK